MFENPAAFARQASGVPPKSCAYSSESDPLDADCDTLLSRCTVHERHYTSADDRRTNGSPRHCQQLGRVQAAAVVAEVGDLVAAAEAGGDDQVIGLCPADGGEEHALA